jgi:ribosomal protein L40E
VSVKTVTATPAPREQAEPGAPVARRRRVPGWAGALMGAVLGGVYGAALEKMAFGPPLVMLILGGMTLALCGLALWRVIDPLTHGDGVVTRETGGRARARELEREKQAVLKAIKEIELDHQMRKIADADYKEMIERYRGRALRLISEIEAGDNFRELIERELKDRLSLMPATAPAPAAKSPEAAAPEAAPAAHEKTGCAACGTINDPDAQFCKKCGAKLAA